MGRFEKKKVGVLQNVFSEEFINQAFLMAQTLPKKSRHSKQLNR